jgi:Mg-chelatase subunit ChlD
MDSPFKLFAISVSKKKVITITIAVFIFLSLPLIVFLLQKQQNIQQKAADLCPAVPVDVLFITDISTSMNDKLSSTDRTTKIASAKSAADTFIQQFANNTTTKIGLVSFSSTDTTMSKPIDFPLTSNYASVSAVTNKLIANGTTCMECGIVKANQEMSSNGRANVKKVYILLSDGRANATVNKPYISDNNPGIVLAEKAASTAAMLAYTTNNVTIYTIGLGRDVNQAFLKNLAIQTGGVFFFPASADNLNSIYLLISRIAQKGSITGYVYNDTNSNGILDIEEPMLSGWTITAKDQTGKIASQSASDISGAFSLTDLCDDAYTVSEIVQPGWSQNSPLNPPNYFINIYKGNSVEKQNFGNFENPLPTATTIPTVTLIPATPSATLTPVEQSPTPIITLSTTPVSTPTATPLPTNPIIDVTLFLHAIGNSGDNVNPASSMSNKNPIHPQRQINVDIFDSLGQLVLTIPSTVQYDNLNGNFTGSVVLDSTLAASNYIIKIKTNQYLRKTFPGIYAISPENHISLSPLSLVAGDVNNDNKLDILDYNIIYGCYATDNSPTPRSCADSQKTLSDINDDGLVNQYDYNLYIREMAVQQGD